MDNVDIFGGNGLSALAVVFFIAMMVVCAIVFAVLPFWMIFSKAGYSGWMSLLQLIPLVNLIVLFYLAFAEWPIQRELRALRERGSGA